MSEYGKQVKKNMDTYMNNPDSIDKEVSDIQNATHGVEVRGALAAGVKKSFDKSKDAEGRSIEAYDITQNLLDETFDSSALEVNFEQRLDDAIDNLQPEWTQFQTKTTSELSDIVTVNHLIDNVGNVTDQLQNLIDNSPDGTVLEFKGTYEIDHIVVNKKDLRFTSRGSTFLINDTSQKGLVLRDADNLIIDGINFEVNFEGLPTNGDHNRDFFIHGTGKNVKVLNCTAQGLGLCRLNYADGCIVQNNKVHSGTTSQEIYDSGHNRLLRGIEIDNTYNFRIIGND
uniref:hypothetical protein n=1 Tax=Gracilibacillus dipsosauri TaxID=178340 RepID=UPI002409BF53